MGYQALLNNNLGSVGGTGNYNVAVGYSAGKLNTTGNNNIFIGNNSGLDILTGSYNTIIGYPLPGTTGDVSNNVILADGQGNIKLQIDATGATTLNGVLNKLNILSTGISRSSGTVTLGSGTATVTTSASKAGSIILLTRQSVNASSDLGELVVAASAGFFIITSYRHYAPSTIETGDKSIIGWVIIN